MKKSFQIAIFIISCFIHIFYYISAYLTHTLDMFFEHVTMGQDFFQIPNAAYAFLHGGTLTGTLPIGIIPYASCCGVNSNVYHPLFTLIVGTPLQFLSPWTAFGIWETLHFFISILTVLFLWKKFSAHKYLYIALSFYLLNSYHYYEIQHAQYHFLLNFFIILFLYTISLKGDKNLAGIWYFASLLVKPIGLLWVIPLLIYKYFKTVFIGIFLYLMASAPFLVSLLGKYFYINLYNAAITAIPSYNLLALTKLFPLDLGYFKSLSIFTALALLLLQIFKKPPIFSIIFLWISFQLIFYNLVFHYHYSILASLIALGILLNIFSLKRFEIIPIVFLTIPTPIIFFHLSGDPAILPTQHLSLVALGSIFWLLVLDASLIYKILKHQPKYNHV